MEKKRNQAETEAITKLLDYKQLIKQLRTNQNNTEWTCLMTHNRLVAGSSPARATKSLFTYQEELRVQGVLDGGLYFMTNAISRKKCGGWFRMRAGVLVRGTPLQCIYPSVLIQKYLEKMPAMPSGQIAYMWN
ncbi:hypothetical protein [Escherichia coli]|nr:hypothetical protein [Escherichia coli]